MINVVILAAGRGSRMLSSLPKVLHTVANEEMLSIVCNVAKSLACDVNLISVLSDEIINNFSNKIPKDTNFVVQKEQYGTGHATRIAVESVYYDLNADSTLILYGDVPLIRTEVLDRLINLKNVYDITILGFKELDRTSRYGRVFCDIDIDLHQYDNIEISAIKEFKDFAADEEMPFICNGGIMCGRSNLFQELLPVLQNNNASSEYYLTDLISLARSRGYKCGVLMCNEDDILGANSQTEMAFLENKMQERLKMKFMNNGVKFLNADSTYISANAVIGEDVIIEPNVYIGKNVIIGDHVRIKAFSYLEGVTIKKNCAVGPFTRIRPGTILEQNVALGNFVEVKNSHLGDATKAGHLCYIGDTATGEHVNFGAGSVVCNYDGLRKHQTHIGSHVFIGSNSSIIAPCNIEDYSFVAAGSVISKLVRKFSLAITRVKQTEIANWTILKGIFKA